MTGIMIFLDVALILAKLPRRLMLKALHHDVALDLAVSIRGALGHVLGGNRHPPPGCVVANRAGAPASIIDPHRPAHRADRPPHRFHRRLDRRRIFGLENLPVGRDLFLQRQRVGVFARRRTGREASASGSEPRCNHC
jgi:hypothetical protein